MDIIVTPRLVLRSPLPNDLRDLHEHVLSDPEVMSLAFSGDPLSLKQSENFFDAEFDHENTGKKLGILIERETRKLIGIAGLMTCRALEQEDYELGFILRRDAWGRGFATEIGVGQVEYGFNALGLSRILAQVSPRNRGSIATLRKIGMNLHGAARSNDRGERLVYVAHRG